MRPLRYLPYDDTVAVPNVIVDGSPNRSTVLTLSHWPGIPSPPGVEADLSAEMAFRYLDVGGGLHDRAEVVSNNHFDQDGLVGVYTLSHPEHALRHRALLGDVAAAGDFGTYRDRTAARISMVIARLAAPGDPYPEALELLPKMIDDIEAFRDRWGDEDDGLTAAEKAIAAGRVTIAEEPDLDLAVVRVPTGERVGGGHRFAHQRDDGIHPMAVHNATGRFRLAILRGRRYELRYRYESWVQYRTQRPLPRIDLTPLARELNGLEGEEIWQGDAVGGLIPRLHLVEGAASRVASDDFLDRVRTHLRSDPPAWDPYDTR